MHYIGLDVGTSSCKASVIDERGRVLASSGRNYGLSFPSSGFVELDPELVWKSVKETLQDIAGQAAEAKALAVSSLGETMVMLDHDDRPLMNGMVYLDQRAKNEPAFIAQKIDSRELFAETLVPLTDMFSLSKMLWLQKNRPEVIERSQHIFLFGDFISFKLSGERVIDPSLASRTMFFDAVNLRWSEKIADLFSIPVDRFSTVMPAGTDIGAILPQVAAETGLPDDLHVVLGTHDQMVALLGSGAVHPGTLTLGEGTAEGLNAVIDKSGISVDAYNSGIYYEPYLEAGRYMMACGQLSHGVCLTWFMNLFGRDYLADCAQIKDAYAAAEATCADDSNDLFFLPYLSRTSATEISSNAPGCYLGLELSTDRNTMYRALLEGLSFETRYLVDEMKHYGLTVDNIVATGGGSKSAILMQAKADVLRQKVNILHNKESGISGLGMICAVSRGEFGSFCEAADNMTRIESAYSPRQELEIKFAKYKNLRRAVLDLYTM